MNKVSKFIRYLIYTLEIYLLHSLQQMPIFSFGILGMTHVLIISGFICISLFEKEFVSMIFGILSGFLIDLSFSNILGFNALILGLIGYAFGILFSYYIKPNFLSAVFFSSTFSVIITYINLFICQIYKGGFSHSMVEDANLSFIGFCAACVSLPIYLFNRAVSYLTREKRNEAKQS